LVFASGSLVYGSDEKPFDESAEIRAISYARQYYKGEIPISGLVTGENPMTIVLRFPWLLGDGSWFKWFYLDHLVKNGVIPQFGNGENRMQIMSVGDAASLMLKYATTITRSGFYNIFPPESIRQHDFLNHISEIYGADVLDYKEVFPKTPEKAAIEAFMSNIILTTNIPEILKSYRFKTAEETLREIKAGLSGRFSENK
jgi:nucleoside-diphosphate-sugar epimerase